MSTLRYRPVNGNLADTIPHFHAGEYHVFYLHGNVGKVPWNHLSTTDFVHWRELPAALISDGEPETVDGFNMYTGCVLEHEGRWHIFYTGCNPHHPEHREFVCHATSQDGIAWTKRPDEAFTSDGKHYDHSRELDFRDPYVFWNDEERIWWMLLCARRVGDRAPVTGLATSRDLVHWQQQAPLCDGFVGTPECPDLFRLNETWYLLSSPCEHVTTYRSAKSLAGPWTPAPGISIDTPVLYAAKRAFDGKRHVLTGWLRDFEPASDDGDFRWGGTLCLPREVFEVAPGELGFRPVPEVRVAFIDPLQPPPAPRTLNGTKMKPGGHENTWSMSVPHNYRLNLQVLMNGAQAFTVIFRAGHGGYRLTLHPAEERITFRNDFKTFPRQVSVDWKKPVRIEAFVIDSLIEVFVDDRIAFSSRAYDFLEGALKLVAEGGEVVISDFNIGVESPKRRLP